MCTALASLTSVVGAGFFCYLVNINRALGFAGDFVSVSGGVAIFFFLLGIVISAGVAVTVADHIFSSMKFCEPCDQFMSHVDLPPISFDSARLIANCAETGRWDVVTKLLVPASEYEAQPTLFTVSHAGEAISRQACALPQHGRTGKARKQ